MTKEKGIPQIRFSGFTDTWEQRELGDVCQINGRIGFRGYTEKDIIPKEQGGVLAFTPTNIVNNQLVLNVKNTYITRAKYDESPEIMVKNGNILFVKTGSTLGKSALVTGFNEDSTVNPQVVVIKTNISNQKILSTILTTDKVQSQVASVKIGGAVPTMTETELKNIELSMPVNEDEKIKIGTFFTELDNLITLHQRKYDKLTKVKKAMLEKMFPKNGSLYPEIRFKGFTDAWEQREFGDENDLITGYPFESDCFSETGINLIRGMNVKRGYIDLSNDICVKWTSSKGLESYLLKENDIIIQMDGALIGKSYGIIKKKHLPALLVQRVTRARINNEIADSDFMYQTIQRDFLTYISMNKTETAVPHLSLNDIKNFGIMVPTLLEQKMIGSFFANLDRLITLHQRKLEKLKNIKKACLEKMFV